MRARARGISVAMLILFGSAFALVSQGAGYSAAFERFIGDFEVGAPGWQQFEGLQYGEGRPLAESYALVETPVRQGQRAARFTTRHGYSPFGHGESTQLLWNGGEAEGQQYWYAWSTLFPLDWVAPYRWGIFVEWHPKLSTSPILAFSAAGDRASFSLLSGLTDERANSAAVDRTVPVLPTLSKGRWNDFVMHVGWSTRNGFVDVYHRVDGSPTLRKVVSFRNVPTFQVTREGRGLGAYLLLGIYRASYCAPPTRLGCTSVLGVQPPSTLYHDGFVRERTFEAAVSKAFSGSVPALPPPSARAVQQEGTKLAPANLQPVSPRGVEAERKCRRCRVVSTGGRIVARVAGSADDRDTAVANYRLRQRNEIVIRQKVQLVTKRLAGPLVLAQLRDRKQRTLLELYVGPAGTLRLASPRGALRARGFDVDTGIAASPGAEPREVEVRLGSSEVRFTLLGRLLVRLTGLDGPARGARVEARVGIERYDGARGGPVSAVYDSLAVGTS